MSWMDSWSRPSKHAATPPPLYLTIGDKVPYCHSCGRVISERRKHPGASGVKYCSARCRNSKPGPVDRRIEAAFAALLDGKSAEEVREDSTAQTSEEKGVENTGPFREKGEKKHKKKASKSVKGDHRIILDCSTVQEVVFQRGKDPEKVYGRRKNRKARFVVEKPEDWRSVDMVDDPLPKSVAQDPLELSSDEDMSSEEEQECEQDGGVALDAEDVREHTDLPDAIEYGYGGGKVRPPQAVNDVNGSVGGEKGWAERIDETDEMKLKRREGQKRADEREMVRRAARRGCAFGFSVPGEEEKRMCEAVMKGAVVEASFAKGEWGIRWREKI